ncbi:hypothetical protein V5O48_010527 [Marasmius crinis-equi]|uniref:DUF6924 domain-containing protein n=1 Tax=Marasmius crinis-equi TaxID=585013 RepID=A0ABR3F8L4_9AGAR
MAERKIALYVSSKDVTSEIRDQIQHDFDTTHDEGRDPRPGWIELVSDSESWSIGLSSQAIHEKHSAEYVPRYPRRPIVILDDRTARDRSVLVVCPTISEETDDWVHQELRFAPRRVPDTAINLVIGNQSLQEYEYHVDEDGVWRWWKNSSTPNPDA